MATSGRKWNISLRLGLAFGLAAFGGLASSCEVGEGQRTTAQGGEDKLGKVQQAAALPEGFQENLVITGRTAPVALRFAPSSGGGPVSAFLAEKSGLLFAYQNIETESNPTQVIDLRNAVHDYWDRGLLGLAVHPNYPSTPQLFVLYTHDAFANGSGPRWGDTCPNPPGDTQDGCVVYGRLSRIDIDPTTLAGTEVPLIEANWCQQYPSHSVGDLHFGADGYLYVSAGDGASFTFNDVGQDGNPVNPCNDPGPVTNTSLSQGGRLRSQDVLTNTDPIGYNGSLLRLDVSGGTVTAPPDNPLVGKGTTDDDFIVATGLRNPYRFTVRPGTNELWIADVGQDAYEELNRVQDPTGAVENFGFPCLEGPAVQSYLQNNVLCSQVLSGNYPAHVGPMVTVAPYYAYHHANSVVAGDGCPTGSSSITGVAFNTSTAYPSEYAGALFFADSSRQCVWAMFAGLNGLPDPDNRGAFISRTSGRVVDIQMGPDGKLYYVDFDGGAVYRIDSFLGNEPPQAAVSASPSSGPAPLTVDFDASASHDAEDGSSLTFAWDFDNDGNFDDASGSMPSHVFTESGAHLVRVQVTDSGGLSAVASTTITVDNSPPVVSILTPTPDSTWAVGDTIAFSGEGIDPEQGPLPAESLTWQVVLHHCSAPEDCHAHPIQSFAGVEEGSFVAPDHDYPSHLELILTATDTAEGWFDPAWQYRRSLTLNHAGLGAVSEFPVLVLLDASRIDYAKVQPQGRDLRFVSASGTVLAHEVELWNPGGVSVVWVKVPSVAAGSTDQRVHMYYGNPGASSTENAAAVWSNGYVAVWHMGDLDDSTGFAHHGSNLGSSEAPGFIGSARSFNGASTVSVPTSTALELTNAVSIEAWARPSSASLDGYLRIVSKKAAWDAGPGYNLELSPSQNFFTALGGGSNYLRGNTTIDANFHYYASSINGTVGALYKDGVNVTSDSSVGAVTASTQPINIGRAGSGGDYFSGQIDELRISNVARPANWFAAQYRSMTDAYLSFGAEEQSSTLGATTSIELYPATAELTLVSEPPGAQIQVGNHLVIAPAAPETAILGSRLSLSVVSPQVIGGKEYVFESWSNGGEPTHLYMLSEDATLTVIFSEVGTVIDTDGDGMPDDWEIEFGFDPQDAGDAELDGDGDRLTNLQEFGNGTHPGQADTDADSWDDFTEITFAGDPLDAAIVPDPPVVSIDAPLPGAVLEGDQIQVDFSTAGLSLTGDHVHLQLDDLPPVSMGALSGSHVFTGVAPGEHDITAHVHGGTHLPYTHAGAMLTVTVTLEEVSLPECGNGIVEAREACDTGAESESCDADCTLPECGDGHANGLAGEECDSAGPSATCDGDCTFAICGDGTLNPAAGEECDDANQVDNDDCNNLCVAASCSDSRHNGNETDVDCGGGCQACPDGAGCFGAIDCQSSVCTNGICQAPSCSDGVHNGNETDVDCGGSCPGCSGGGLTLTLPTNNDWGSGYCAVLNITNLSNSPTTTWQVAFDTHGTSIYTSWNGTFSANNGMVTVTPISWNRVIQPGATDSSIGFCANRSSGSAVATPVSATGTF